MPGKQTMQILLKKIKIKDKLEKEENRESEEFRNRSKQQTDTCFDHFNLLLAFAITRKPPTRQHVPTTRQQFVLGRFVVLAM